MRRILPSSLIPTLLSALLVSAASVARASEAVYFRRGDANADATFNISDAVYTLEFLFTGASEPPCLRAVDANDDGTLNMTDAVYLLGFLFVGGPPPPSPGLECGYDATLDELYCLTYPTCVQPSRPFEVVDGDAVIEGDIIIGRAADIPLEDDVGEGRIAGFLVENLGERWPGNLVPYRVSPMLPNPWRVADAIQHWEERTSIRFVERTAADAALYPDFVSFVVGSGCRSSVGRQSGEQFIRLAAGCGRGAVIHEIGHAIGLWHEQSRLDRDSYVRILTENIDPAMLYNFEIQPGVRCSDYDYDSIMHYGEFAFSANGLPTIETIPPGIEIGQRDGLSSGDVRAVERFYDVGALLAAEGRLTLLRVHDVGTGFGAADNELDVEVVLQLNTRPDESFGFQLRTGRDEFARRGMLDLARDAFVQDRIVRVDYRRTGCRVGEIVRIQQLD